MARDSETAKTDRQLIEETAQRARRTETRVTQIAAHLGVDHGGEKPEWRDNKLYVPSLKVSLQDVIDALAPHTAAMVYCGDEFLVTVQR